MSHAGKGCASCKTIAMHNGDNRHHRRHCCQPLKSHQLQLRNRNLMRVCIVGATAAAFRIEDKRQFAALHQFQQSVNFAVMKMPLRSGHDGIIDNQYCDRFAINQTRAHQHTIGGGTVNQFLFGVGSMLGGKRMPSNFAEAAMIQQIIEIFPRCSPAHLMAFLNPCPSPLIRQCKAAIFQLLYKRIGWLRGILFSIIGLSIIGSFILKQHITHLHLLPRGHFDERYGSVDRHGVIGGHFHHFSHNNHRSDRYRPR